LYPDIAKVAKQFQHADKRSIPFASGKMKLHRITLFLKNLATGATFIDFEGLKKAFVKNNNQA
jgi:histidyl-tRNA synthetase